MSKQFSLLIQKLRASIDGYEGDGVNEERCRVEAEIIGYLIGRKVIKKDPEYVPEDLEKYLQLSLPKLNLVAIGAALEMLPAQQKILSENSRE